MTSKVDPPRQDWNAEVIDRFRANGGEIPMAPGFDNEPDAAPPPMLLLHTIGARSGREHIVPMRGMPHEGVLYVIASAHGRDRHPDWYRNVVAHPEFPIEIGTETVPFRATVLTGTERQIAFDRHKARFPRFAEYERDLTREIPVIRLERVDVEKTQASGQQAGMS